MTESDTEYTYVCPICGYTNDRRLTASSHIVNKHLICVDKSEVIALGGVPPTIGTQWRDTPDDIEALQ